MRKSVNLFFRCFCICSIIMSAQSLIHAQVSNPSQWETFVKSPDNRLVKDTFRLQTFGQGISDNWTYTTTGNVSIQDLSEVRIEGERGQQGLKMALNSQASFEHYPLSDYQDICITVHKGGEHLMPGEEMKVRTYRQGETQYPSINIIKTEDAENSFSSSAIKRMPPGVDLIVPNPAKNSLQGCYYVDSVYAHGLIASHSLFTGTGNWNDTTRWSHLPPQRHRTALLDGDILVDSPIQCDHVAIGNGELRISPSGNVSAQTITIYSDDLSQAAIESAGSLHIKDRLHVEKTFATKGTWYFLSFPFDVYPSGIDPDFQMGDETSNTTGNYFYVQTYNGSQRFSSQNATNNWDVLSAQVMQTAEPVFKKNIGYLVAIDASAERNTLRFSSQPHAIPSDFGKSADLTIQVAPFADGNKEHHGWFLCGNPFPAPLSLADIPSDSALDGFIYMYDGTKYEAYKIGSDSAIPPFAAFFVKAHESTRLSLRKESAPRPYQLIPAHHPLKAGLNEPVSVTGNTTACQEIMETSCTFQLNDHTISVDHLPSNGTLQVITVEGKMMVNKELTQGNSTIPHSLSAGVYLFIIRAKGLYLREKIAIHH